jgi:hypothetical protein
VAEEDGSGWWVEVVHSEEEGARLACAHR